MTVYNGMYFVYDGLWWYIMVYPGISQYGRVFRSIGRYIKNSKNMHDPEDSNPVPLAYKPAYSTAKVLALLPQSQSRI